jgi:GT2 family glycosyltransferase
MTASVSLISPETRTTAGPLDLETGHAAFYRVGDQAVGGWVLDPAQPGQRFVVEIRVDGECAALVLAESFVPELRQRFGGDGCHGFVVLLDPARTADAAVIEAYVANTQTRLGSVPVLMAPDAPAATGRIAGELRWAGGLRLAGWACDVACPVQPLAIEILVDGETTGQVLPNGWRESQAGDVAPSGRFAFDASLPARFADGRAHTVRALAGGVDLAGSPTLVLAHEQGYAGLAREIDPDDRTGALTRAQLLDRLMPAAIPVAEFPAWRARFPVDAPAPATASVAVLIVGDDEAALQATVDSLHPQSHTAWSAVALAAREGTFAADDFDHAAASIVDAGADVVVIVEAGALLDRHAVGHFAVAFADDRFPGLVYADSILRTADGGLAPSFKPAFDRRRLQSQGYAADVFAAPAATLDAIRADRPGGVYELLLSCVRRCEQAGEPIAHLPQLLATLPPRDMAARSAQLALAAEAEAARRGAPRIATPLRSTLHPAVALAWPANVRPEPVSIIIPTRDRVDLLEPCIDTLLRGTSDIAFEIIVVDNGSRLPATRVFFERLKALGGRVIPADFPFNYAKLNNIGVAAARHDLVCFLNNDVEVIEEHWLREMALELGEPGVGAVGATLLWPSRIVQHGGVVLGPHFAAGHAFNDRIDGEAGYDEQLLVARSQSAVTAACLLMRKADYHAVGGMDEAGFPVAFNDVDLCLKLRQAGKSVLLTPHARLLHKESASRGLDVTHEKRSRARKETAALRERWAHVLEADPFYNPNLCLDLYPFSGLATPPRSRELRFDGQGHAGTLVNAS